MRERVETFLVSQDFKSPYVVHTGNGRNPTSIQYRAFAKGDQVRGVMHYSKGKPAFVLCDGMYVIPLNTIKRVVVKDVIVSNASGNVTTASTSPSSGMNERTKKYLDAALVGALIGFGVNWFAEKKSWIMPDKNNKFIAMGIGAFLSGYIVYRINPKATIVDKTK